MTTSQSWGASDEEINRTKALVAGTVRPAAPRRSEPTFVELVRCLTFPSLTRSMTRQHSQLQQLLFERDRQAQQDKANEQEPGANTLKEPPTARCQVHQDIEDDCRDKRKNECNRCDPTRTARQVLLRMFLFTRGVGFPPTMKTLLLAPDAKCGDWCFQPS